MSNVITRQKEYQEWFKRSIPAVRRWLRAQPRVKKFSATFILDDAWDDWAEGSEWTEECDNGDELVVACLSIVERALRAYPDAPPIKNDLDWIDAIREGWKLRNWPRPGTALLTAARRAVD